MKEVLKSVTEVVLKALTKMSFMSFTESWLTLGFLDIMYSSLLWYLKDSVIFI